MSTTTTTLQCPVCDAPGFPPDAREWPSHDPIWTEGRRYLCSGCGSWLVVKVDDGRACLVEERERPSSVGVPDVSDLLDTPASTERGTRLVLPTPPEPRKPVADADGLLHDRAHVEKPETRAARSVKVKPRKPLAAWAEEADGDTWALEVDVITAFVTEDCDGVRADIEVTDNDPVIGTFQHDRKAAQLAAEDALRAIADQIYAALRGGV